MDTKEKTKMSLWKFLGNIVEPITDLISELVPTEAKKAEAKKKLIEILSRADSDLDKEITKRHSTDMVSDSWLSKNVRPLALSFLLLMFVFISIFDGNIPGAEFEIAKEYIPVYQTLLTTAFIFYFGSRGFEKWKSIKGKGKG